MYSAFPGITASPISFLSMTGVCGLSLTDGKILFTRRQTCSLYLVLCLAGIVGWSADSVDMLTNALQFRSQPGTDFFVLSVCCCVQFLASLCYQEYSCVYHTWGS